MRSKNTAITIPIYKERPCENEIISFSQALKVLNNYDIVIVCPKTLNTKIYNNIAEGFNKKLQYKYFDDSFFKSINGYNQLMLSKLFYESFLAYEYILVYQLDCFVFRDDIEKWVSTGYDYIGAPWLHNDRRNWWTLKNRIKYNLKALYRRYSNKPITISMGYYKVGNGGFSMRNVKKSIEIINKFEANHRIDIYRTSEDYLYAEDVFWGCEVNRYIPNIRIPKYREALNFSFDMNPSLSYELNDYKLPFGCHAWYRYEPLFWKKFIEEIGYSIDLSKIE